MVQVYLDIRSNLCLLMDMFLEELYYENQCYEFDNIEIMHRFHKKDYLNVQKVLLLS